MTKLAWRVVPSRPAVERSGRAQLAGISAAAVAAFGAIIWSAEGVALAAPMCPSLMVLGVQGTGESSPSASATTDTGMLGSMFAPMLALSGGTVDRQYVAYPAGFGGAVPGGPFPYAQSEQIARERLWRLATNEAARCPSTMLALAGYSQGAHAVSEFARSVGAGRGPVPSDRVAGVALFADPSRPPDGTVLPGLPGAIVPMAAPGTSGRAVSQIRLPGVPGGVAGIGAVGGGFGTLTGRVGEFCVSGDLACAAPDRAALLRTAAGVAAQADLRDPFVAVGSLGHVWSQVKARAWVTVMAQDITDGPAPTYRPKRALSQRLADAASPTGPMPSPQEVERARATWGRVVAAMAANPLGELGGLFAQMGAVVGSEIEANRDLLDPAAWLPFADVGGRHRSYAVPDGGPSATEAAARWFSALGRDIAGRIGGR